MTTLVHYHDDTGVWIGADSLCVDGAKTKMHELAPYAKWEVHDNLWAIGGAGDGQLIQFVQAHWVELAEILPVHPQMPDDAKALFKAGIMLREAFKVSGMQFDEKTGADVEGIVVGPDYSWSFTGFFEFSPIAPEHMAIQGSGGKFALGAWHATRELKMLISTRLRIALEAAMHYDLCSGPPCWIRELTNRS